MKFRPVTKLVKRNKTASKNFDNDAMSANCDNMVIFLIFDQFGAIRKLDSGCTACKCKVIFFINSNLLPYNN